MDSYVDDAFKDDGKTDDITEVSKKLFRLQEIHNDLVAFCDDILADNKELKKQISKLNKQISDLMLENPPTVLWHDVETDGLPEKHGMYFVFVHESVDMDETGNGGWIQFMEYHPNQKVWSDDCSSYNAVLECVNKNKSSFVSHWAEKPRKPV